MFFKNTSKSKLSLMQIFILVFILTISPNVLRGVNLTAEEKIALEEEQKRKEEEANLTAEEKVALEEERKRLEEEQEDANRDKMGTTAQPTSKGQFQTPASKAAISGASTQAKEKNTSSYTTNELTEELQIAINRFNEDNPNYPITSISTEELSSLVKAELISRKKIEEFLKLTIINGKVYVKKDNSVPQEPIPDKSPKNLFGSFDTACQSMSDGNTRGNSKGNEKPKKRVDWRNGKIQFRDKNNALRSFEYSYPLVNLVSPIKILGKRYKAFDDFVTKILIKNRKTSLFGRDGAVLDKIDQDVKSKSVVGSATQSLR